MDKHSVSAHHRSGQLLVVGNITSSSAPLTTGCATGSHTSHTAVHAAEPAAGPEPGTRLDAGLDRVEGEEHEVDRETRHCAGLGGG